MRSPVSCERRSSRGSTANSRLVEAVDVKIAVDIENSFCYVIGLTGQTAIPTVSATNYSAWHVAAPAQRASTLSMLSGRGVTILEQLQRRFNDSLIGSCADRTGRSTLTSDGRSLFL